MMIPRRYAGLLNAFAMAVVLPFFMTMAVTLVNLGFSERFFGAWMRTWGIAVVVAFPLILLLSPLIRKGVSRITAD